MNALEGTSPRPPLPTVLAVSDPAAVSAPPTKINVPNVVWRTLVNGVSRRTRDSIIFVCHTSYNFPSYVITVRLPLNILAL